MTISSFPGLSFLVLALALAPAGAAGQGAGLPEHPVALAQGVGWRAVPEGFRGGGPDYRVELGAGGMRFTPALGRGAERTFPVAYDLEEITVGGVALPCAAAAPEASGSAVLYRRGTVTERYELTAAGLEQSFVFDTLPAGRGEVRVRGRLATELPAVEVDARLGLVFERTGLGGVRYGGVTGVDADGNTAAGWVRLEDGVIEFGLPADFVATAALPLVLDPLLVPLIPLETATGPAEDEVDVAFDEDGGYLAVWTRTFSSGDTEIRGQLVDEEGNLDGGLLLVSESDLNTSPAVGSIDSGNKFIVAWEHRSTSQPDADVHACAVDGDDGLVTAEIPVGATAADEVQPDVGQDWFGCPVVWRELASGLKGASVQLDAFGDPSVSFLYTVTTNSMDRTPRFSSTHTTWKLLVWVRDSLFLSDAIHGQRFIGHPTQDEFLINASVNQLSSPVCALSESGDDALVVWSSANSFGSSDIYGKRVIFPSSDPVVGSLITIEKDAASDDRLPDIAYAKHQYIVAYLAGNASSALLKAVALDPMTGARLELMSVAGPAELTAPAVAGVAGTYFSGPGPEDGVLIAWTEAPGSGSDVLAALAEGFAGFQDGLFSSGCLVSGHPRASALHSPNPGHRQELWGAPPGQDAILGIGWTPFSLPLGEASLLIDPAHALALYAGPVGADGYLGLDVPLPAGLAGASLWFQWALIPSAAPCTSLGVDLSTALEAVVE